MYCVVCLLPLCMRSISPLCQNIYVIKQLVMIYFGMGKYFFAKLREIYMVLLSDMDVYLY
jgi:hypothetical protein